MKKPNDKEAHRPWGYYLVLEDQERHKVKRIVVKPGKRLSLQRHQRRSEHWFFLFGKGIVTLNEKELKINPGEAVDIPVKTKHRVQNLGSEELVFIEIQTGDYFGEDDIERFEDDFGRV